MSTTAPSASALKPAPWKSQFQEHLNKMDSPEFVLSSLAATPSGSPVPYVPRARYCIFRGFWAELPENKHNDAPRNERIYESDLPTFTTDIRMQKVPQIFGTSSGKAESLEQVQGSGGGGPVEAVWWIKDVGVQWRVKGEAFVVGEDIEGNNESSGVRTVKSEVGSRMRVVKEGKVGEWSWKKELTGHWGNMSPGMRGSFRNPPPGTPVTEPYDEKNLSLGQKVSDLEDPIGRKNFRVVIVKPEEVESTHLSDPVKARRHRYTFKNGEWEVEELWP